MTSWYTIDCTCRNDGPWICHGPTGISDLIYYCARCGQPMAVTLTDDPRLDRAA
jgi:hypothetical protein